MCIHVHIYMFIYVCICICVYMHIRIQDVTAALLSESVKTPHDMAYIYINVYIFIHMHIYICTYIIVYIFIHIYIYICVCTCICIYIHVRIQSVMAALLFGIREPTLIERNPPLWGGFLCTMFPHQDLQHTATHCNTLQHTTTHYNTRFPMYYVPSSRTVCKRTPLEAPGTHPSRGVLLHTVLDEGTYETGRGVSFDQSTRTAPLF